MKNIAKLMQNTDLSLEKQAILYDHIKTVSTAIEVGKNHYEECKELFIAADANLDKAIAEGDEEAKLEAAQEIIEIVPELHETRESIKQLTIKLQNLYKMLMNHQKSDEHQKRDEQQKSDEHVYVLPRQQAFKLLKALTEGIKADPDFKTVTLAIDTCFLKK